MAPLPPSAAARAQPLPPISPDSIPVPRNAAEAQRLAATFLLQMDQVSSTVGVDPTGDENSDDDGTGAASGDLGMGGDTMGLLAGMLGLAAPSAGATQATQGAGVSQLTSLLGAAGQSGLGADLLPSAESARNTSAAAASPSSGNAAQNAQIVAAIARRHGVDPALAVAMMLVESGGNSRAVGDGGTSFGLFQLHQGGMLTSAGLTPQQAFDPATNANVSISALAHQQKIGPNRSPGAIAAASQRPADPAGYAAKVNATIDRARQLLAGG